MKKRNRIIMGTAIGLATVLAALDHTKHKLPEAEIVSEQQINFVIDDEDESSPCSMGEDSSPAA